MNKNYFSSDRYANSHDNLSWRVSQFADSIQDSKNILSVDSFSLCLTVFPLLTADIKSGQLRFRLTIAQTQTAPQNIGKQILQSVRLAHLRPCFKEESIIGRKKSKHPAIKNALQKNLYSTFFRIT